MACFPLHCKVYNRVLCINVIKEKGSILLRVEKTKRFIHLGVIE